MPTARSASEVLNRDFLPLRAGLISLAAAMDHIGRAEGSVANDPRWNTIQQGLQILAAKTPDRAERLQLLFSLPYRENWAEGGGRKEEG
jgi:hypothetical protein